MRQGDHRKPGIFQSRRGLPKLIGCTVLNKRLTLAAIVNTLKTSCKSIASSIAWSIPMLSFAKHQRFSWLIVGCVSLTLLFGSGMHSLLSPASDCGCCPSGFVGDDGSIQEDQGSIQEDEQQHACGCHSCGAPVTAAIDDFKGGSTTSAGDAECSVCRFLAMVSSTAIAHPVTVSPLSDSYASFEPELTFVPSRLPGLFGPRGPPSHN